MCHQRNYTHDYLRIEKIDHLIKILNRIGPKTDPCGTSLNDSSQLLKKVKFFAIYHKDNWAIFALLLNPSKQLQIFPQVYPALFSYFSIIVISAYCALNPFLYPQSHFSPGAICQNPDIGYTWDFIAFYDYLVYIAPFLISIFITYHF